MELFISLQQACAYLTNRSQETYIPVFCTLPDRRSRDSWLRVDINDHPDEFDLRIDNSHGLALALPCFLHATRHDRDDMPAKAEDFTKRGRDIAESLHFGSAGEYLAAWVNEDRKQAALCRDMDAVLQLKILSRLPEWIRLDLFCILESEAMKQIFARRFFIEDQRETMQPPAPAALRQSMRDNANNRTDDLVSTLMRELLQKPMDYKGSAAVFEKHANERIAIFRTLF